MSDGEGARAGQGDASDRGSGFDPTGSHPLPNMGLGGPSPETRGCGCELSMFGPGAPGIALVLVLTALVIRGRRR